MVHCITYPSVLPNTRICRTLILMRLGIICCYQHCSLLGNTFLFIDFLKGLQYVVAFALIMNDMESCKDCFLLITNEESSNIYFYPNSSFISLLVN